MPIYTRTGDKGYTSLFGGTRVLKSDKRVEAYGTIDELNSTIGLVIAQRKAQVFDTSSDRNGVKSKTDNEKVIDQLEQIQQDLFAIGSALAMPKAKPVNGIDKRPAEFESLIDKLTDELPPLQNFILPGGGKAGSLLHVARTVSRRAERQVVNLSRYKKVDIGIVMYLNRLSDLLFTLARYINFMEKQKEIVWKKT